MRRVFLAGPLRTAADREYLQLIESALVECDFEVFVPAKGIGILSKQTADLRPLQRNLDELSDCDMAVFVLDQERTGTGIELGYLCSLKASGQSQARLFGISRTDQKDSLDLMARYCLDRFGRLVCSVQELIDAVSPLREQQNRCERARV